ncbi:MULTISPECIES: GHKL domain-containing protein [unclassified Lactobacillus]|uniref:GHKL domain-containing protein n=1 Tax=unclassified Lactobacillus TaxID=2620435 RepID=UPI002240A39D|nr:MULTISPECIES: GHKL domain-containing protein [unclassified Lactobacillus]
MKNYILILFWLQPIFIICLDFISIATILKIRVDKRDLLSIGIIILLLSGLSLWQFYHGGNDYLDNTIEMISWGLYFFFYKKYFSKVDLINTLLLVSNIDLGISIIGNIIDDIIPLKESFFDIDVIIVALIVLTLILKFKNYLNNLVTNQNKYLFLLLNLYIYITVSFIYQNILKLNNLSESAKLSTFIFLVQLIFLIGMYIVAVRTRKNILNKAKQEQKEAQLKQLKIENQKINEEYAKLKEYAEYLDKNEDELRKFKHDYQNILNSLRVSAENDNANELIKKLDQYTNSQINNKALRKYKGINHVKAEGLKSIAIAKLAKLYNLKIDYSFDCVKDVTNLPKGVNELDITRIIGIAFDNAIEASLEMRNKNQKPFVAAMYLEEDGTFEFEIRNKVLSQENTKKISQKGYTTKKDHLGIGLANVKEIAKKYRKNVLIDYGYNEDYFIFNLVIVPFKDWQESEN